MGGEKLELRSTGCQTICESGDAELAGQGRQRNDVGTRVLSGTPEVGEPHFDESVIRTWSGQGIEFAALILSSSLRF